MSERRRTRTPSYRLHKPTGQAIVSLNGKIHYLGRHGTEVSLRKYDRLISEWLAGGRHLPDADEGGGLTVGELVLRYWDFARGYYLKDGLPTSEISSIRHSVTPLNDLYADLPAGEFGPLALKAVRERMIARGLSRGVVNDYIGRIKRILRWGVENELVPAEIYHGLQAVAGLRRGRSEARETEPVKPVPDIHVDAIRPFVCPQVWAMIELQRLTGMRSGEVVQMRASELDMSGRIWSYVPRTHKTIHHGRQRKIWLGPAAQRILTPFLKADLGAHLFSPMDARQERFEEMRRGRKTPVQPSQVCRKKARPERMPGECYTSQSYGRTIARACRAAGVPHWHPHRLRHNAATRIRREFGLEAARAVLGHSTVGVTQHYAEMDEALASRIAVQAG